MFPGSFIILKEFQQAARRRRTYFLRAALPAVALAILIPRIGMVVSRTTLDWRNVAEVCRPVFVTCSWLQLVVFSLLGTLTAGAGLREEWTRKTLETLSITMVSQHGIVYGKFLAAIGKIFIIGLALLPVTGIWFRLGRIPPEVALGTVAVTGVAAVLSAALSVFRAAATHPATQRFGADFHFPFLYAFPLVLAGVLVWPSHPVIVAGIPPWALAYVIEGTAPGGMSATRFAVLAVIEPLAVSAILLGLLPVLFRRTFRRFLEGDRFRGPRLVLWRKGRRQPLRLEEDPFAWQEKGASTRAVRWGAWWTVAGFGVAGVVAWCLGEGFFAIPDFYGGMLTGTVVAMTAATAFWGTGVFVREKVGRTAEALILTGRTGASILYAKVRALVWGLRGSFIAVAGALSVYVVSSIVVAGTYETSPHLVRVCCWTLAAVLMQPVVGIIAMVFSVSAPSHMQAFLGFLLAPVVLAGVVTIFLPATIMLGFLILPVGIGLAVFGVYVYRRCVKSWAVWSMSFRLARDMFLVPLVALPTITIAGVLVRLDELGSDVLMLVAAGAGLVFLFYAWLDLGSRIFDGRMLEHDSRS